MHPFIHSFIGSLHSNHSIHSRKKDPDKEVLAVLAASGIPYRPDRPLASATRHFLTRATQVCRAEADRVAVLQALERIEATFEVSTLTHHRCRAPLDECKVALKRLFVMKMLG